MKRMMSPACWRQAIIDNAYITTWHDVVPIFAVEASPMAVSFRELLDAFEFVNSGMTSEHEAFLCKQTGQILWHSEYGDDLDEIPDGIDDEGKYIAIPDKRELDLGRALVFDFADRHLPDEFEEIRRIFSKKGAYARFKHLLERRGALKQWYEFEASVQEKALREWCKANSIEVSD